jgi:hypothetical protein
MKGYFANSIVETFMPFFRIYIQIYLLEDTMEGFDESGNN